MELTDPDGISSDVEFIRDADSPGSFVLVLSFRFNLDI